ncbi:MAG: family 10 glycosylhydrolase [Planctomycetes bacterium]|nr:family 10 glycosylhydrolase [Planctomycetota bacterium]
MRTATLPVSLLAVPILGAVCALPAQESELRGVWLTPRTLTGFLTRAELAKAMDTLAQARINTVYVNAWSRGWPLWRSQVFAQEFGHATDPAAGDRDLLAEALVEGHRAGLEVVAWMEYGFVGWWTGNEWQGPAKGPIFARHPEWLLRTQQRVDLFPAGTMGSHHWMAPSRDDVQTFLCALHAEVAARYDLDGIQLDRIRYPGLDAGYESLDEYRMARGLEGTPKPDDPAWMRWRADAIVEFQEKVYRAVQQAAPGLHVSNAPSHYATTPKSYPAYDSYLQDWRQWLHDGSVDSVVVQMYMRPEALRNAIPSALDGVPEPLRAKVFAGVTVRIEALPIVASEVNEQAHQVRRAGLAGHVFWYYDHLADPKVLEMLRTRTYRGPAVPPYRKEPWRSPAVILDEARAARTGFWREHRSADDHDGACLRGPALEPLQIEYRATVPEAGRYTVHVWLAKGGADSATKVAYRLRPGKEAESGTLVTVDQSKVAASGWQTLDGVLTLEKGEQPVLRVQHAGAEKGRWVHADAVMLLRTRR